MYDFRTKSIHTIIHRNHDIEMRLLGWNKDNDNQPEIHGSIGKIHKSLAIYRLVYMYSNRGLKLRKTVYRVLCRNLRTFFLFSLRISTT